MRASRPWPAEDDSGGGGLLTFTADGSSLFASYAVFDPSGRRSPSLRDRHANARSRGRSTAASAPGPRPTARSSPAGPSQRQPFLDDLAGHPALHARRLSSRSGRAAACSRPRRHLTTASSPRDRGFRGRHALARGRLAASRGRRTAAGWRCRAARSLDRQAGDLAHTRRLLADWGGVLAFTPDSRFVSTQSSRAAPCSCRWQVVARSHGLDGGLRRVVARRSPRIRRLPTCFPMQAGLAIAGLSSRYPWTRIHAWSAASRTTITPSSSCLASRRAPSAAPDLERAERMTSMPCPATAGRRVCLTHDPRNLGAPRLVAGRHAHRLPGAESSAAISMPARRSISRAWGERHGRASNDDADDLFVSDPSYSPGRQGVVFSHSTFDSSGMQIVDVGATHPPAAAARAKGDACLVARRVEDRLPRGSHAHGRSRPSGGAPVGDRDRSPGVDLQQRRPRLVARRQPASGGRGRRHLSRHRGPAGRARVLRSACASAEYPSFSPDGTQSRSTRPRRSARRSGRSGRARRRVEHPGPEHGAVPAQCASHLAAVDLRACDGCPCRGPAGDARRTGRARVRIAAQCGLLARNLAGRLIVFASDRAKYNPGEIYSLAPGSAPRDVSRSLAADYGLAVAPRATRSRSGAAAAAATVYLARSDGSRLRRVRQAGGDIAARAGSGGARSTFSADGSPLVAVRRRHRRGLRRSTRGTATARALRRLRRRARSRRLTASSSPAASAEARSCSTSPGTSASRSRDSSVRSGRAAAG